MDEFIKKRFRSFNKTIKLLPEDFFEEFSFEITGPGIKSDIENLKKLINKLSLEKKYFIIHQFMEKKKLSI